MAIVATAGHVDHGKSTLVEALTGRDPDRLAEEKERGLTIDLGFAWTRLGGHEVGFVDVPGHERFIKNMLAGVGALDVALFVVAADEGWMPQSEEHLAILELLDTRHGVIALTRIDTTDPETADVAELGILEAVEQTRLEHWPVVRVSPVTGEGMELLRTALTGQLAAAGTPPDLGRPRLWIDRSFHIAGAGRVVTGTLSGGHLAVGDELMIWPDRAAIRVRGLQSHDRPVDRLGPGSRAALNVTGVDRMHRGDMVGLPEAFGTTTEFLSALQPVRGLAEELSSRGAFHLHIGTGAWPARLRLLTSGVGILRTADAVPLQMGDRFILRDTGRRAVVAGGRVLDPHPGRDGAALRTAVPALTAALAAEPADRADALLAVRGTADRLSIFQDSGGGRPRSRYGDGDTIMAEAAAARLARAVAAAAAAFHREHRLRPGIPKAQLSSSLGVSGETINLVIGGSDELSDDGATVRLSGFTPGLDAAEQRLWEHARTILEKGLAVPRASQLGLSEELLHALIRDESLVQVAPDLVFLPGQIDQVTARLPELGGGFTVAAFRDLLGITRRQAVPLLEWLDRHGITQRRGDLRVLREEKSS